MNTLLLEILGVPAPTILWSIFGLLIAVFMIVDLGITNRTPHVISTKSATYQTLFWISCSFAFAGLIYWIYDPPPTPKGVDLTGKDAAIQFLAAYLTEYALSVDNIFVIIVILRYFQVEEKYHHKVLFWGILGALLMRGLFIFLGVILVSKFHFILYFFGAILIYTGYNMLAHSEEQKIDFERSKIIRLARRFFNFTSVYHGGKFYIREHGKLLFTPLFMVIIFIESTDLIFAIDSIPAVFAITQDQIVLYTSNIFAIMGLRAMFFLLSGVLNKFFLLKKGLAFVLIFIGGKMLFELLSEFKATEGVVHFVERIVAGNGTLYSLLTIVALLGGSIVLSLLLSGKKKEAEAGDEE